MSELENRCIAYIYNEMDPSERLEFERELESDEDLLIELESLRSTAGCLNGLKYVEPPEFVMSNVMKKAESSNSNQTYSASYRYLFASAAVTLFAVLIYGTVFMQEQQSDSSTNLTGNNASPASVSASGTFSAVSASAGDKSGEVSPWIDHDEVIHFHERFNRGSVASVDSMFNSSLKKLTRVNSTKTIQQVQQQIHLTGGNR